MKLILTAFLITMSLVRVASASGGEILQSNCTDRDICLTLPNTINAINYEHISVYRIGPLTSAKVVNNNIVVGVHSAQNQNDFYIEKSSLRVFVTTDGQPMEVGSADMSRGGIIDAVLKLAPGVSIKRELVNKGVLLSCNTSSPLGRLFNTSKWRINGYQVTFTKGSETAFFIGSQDPQEQLPKLNFEKTAGCSETAWSKPW